MDIVQEVSAVSNVGGVIEAITKVEQAIAGMPYMNKTNRVNLTMTLRLSQIMTNQVGKETFDGSKHE